MHKIFGSTWLNKSYITYWASLGQNNVAYQIGVHLGKNVWHNRLGPFGKKMWHHTFVPLGFKDIA